MLEFELSSGAGPRSRSRIRVGTGALDRLVRELAEEPPGRLLVVVSDSNVGPLHAAPLARRLRRLRGLRVATLGFPAGERHKTRRTKQALEDGLAALGAGRDTAILAVGGGVTGDLAGFVAATWNRGVPVVQVPTSLVAMADAAVGGKTGVNLGGIKNRVGAFHPPWGVYADVAVLDTLPDRHLADGFAEIVKSAAIADASLFRRLERDHAALAGRDRDALTEVVAAALRIKGRIVASDARETGRRAALNFGHTVAHALETVTRHRLSHGRAVAIGMSVEGELAVRATGFPRRDLDRLRALVEVLGLPRRPARPVDPDAVLRAARGDKKNRAGRIHCALPASLGRMPRGASPSLAVAPRALRAALAAAFRDAPGKGPALD